MALACVGYTAAHPEAFAQQPGELGQFVLKNKQQIVALGLKLFGAQGFWATALAYVLSAVIDECVDPWRRNREFRSALDAQNQNVLQQLEPVRPRSKPVSVDAKTERLTVKAASSGVPGWAPLVVPWDQTIRITYHVVAGAAPCYQEYAIAQIVGNDGGTVRAFWRVDAEGVAKAFNSETVSRYGTTEVELPAGAYMVQAAYFEGQALLGLIQPTGQAMAEVTVEYETAPIPWWAFVYEPWFKWALAGAGVAAVGAGAYLLAKR